MFENDEVVQIKSNVSKYKDAIGVVVGYCNGTYKDICKVKLWKNKVIKIFDYNLAKYQIEQ